jgi:hypothetical protein
MKAMPLLPGRGWDGDRVDLLLAKCARISIAKAALRQRTRVLDGTAFARGQTSVQLAGELACKPTNLQKVWDRMK